MFPRHLRRFASALLGTAFVLLAGCTQIRVKSDFNPQADFSRLNTYAWLPGLNPTNDPRLDTKLLDNRVRAAVDRELAAKGFRKVADDSASFYVAYHPYLMRGTQSVREPVGPYTYRWWGGWGPTYTYQFDEGTLAVDVIDPRANELMWRGAASATIDPRASPKTRGERVDQAIHSVLEKFPPPAK